MPDRRNFLKQIAAGSVVLPSLARSLSGKTRDVRETGKYAEEKEIRIALIGKGGMGTADANCALSTPNVKITAPV